MKIVCDACGAKYSIADEKVRGKVFKIRCKRCSNIIVVRGDEGAAAEAAPEQDQKETRVFDYSGYDNPSDAAAAGDGDEAIWHLVIDQEQIGPMTKDEVMQRFQRGEIDGDTYVWHEGFADWERLADVDTFASLAGDGGAAPEVDDAGAGMFGGPAVEDSQTAQNDPADLFAAAAGGAGVDPGADLFGTAASDGADSLFAGGDDGGADDAAADLGLAATAMDMGGGDGLGVGAGGGLDLGGDDDGGEKLRGERNENSVLFSLSNLASLASDTPAPAPSSSSSSGGGAGATTAQGEGSGLIDIRSMAQVYLGGSGDAGPAAPASPSAGSIDDLPSFAPAAFQANSAVLLPTAPAENDNKKLLYILIGAAALLGILAVVLIVMLMGGDDDKEVASAGDNVEKVDKGPGEAANSGNGGEGDKVAANTGNDEKKPPEGGGESDPPKETNTPPENTDPPPTDEKPEKKPKAGKPDRRRDRDKKPKPKAEKKPEAKPEPKKPKPKSGGCDEIACLVEPDKACCRKYGGGRKKPKTNSNLPERPSRSQVKSAIGRVRGRVNSCGSKHGGSGTVRVRVKVSGSGKVASASPSPGNALGKCVASAVRRARFPKTQRGATFTYPFKF